ncbi:MAG TPA: ion transporter [Flavobacteriales bacterium]|nr:ion transporter [Flavobacteriales bacterium]HIK62464.1 ion transporter [Flavobacteriales bacterium]
MENNNTNSFRHKIHEIIFEADTFYGKLFDIVLLITIVSSVVAVMLESIDSIHQQYGDILRIFEWIVTILFTIEYFLRIYAVNKPLKYIFSFMGIIDLLAVIPTYLIFIFPAAHFFTVVRSIRLIRVFRVFKLSHYLRGAHTMQIALRSSRPKIVVFLLSVMILVIVLGTLMYIIEGSSDTNGFDNIPNSIYWAIVTLTTVGYGDVFPATAFGKVVASFIMILGYGIIAVPTGIVTAEFSRKKREKVSTQACPDCTTEGHEVDAKFCKKCGTELNP